MNFNYIYESFEAKIALYFLMTLPIFILVEINRSLFKKYFIVSEPIMYSDIIRDIFFSLTTFAIRSFVDYFYYNLITINKVTKLYYSHEKFGYIWFVLSFVFLIFFVDFYFYFYHRIMHKLPILKQTHHIHHLTKSPTPFTAFAFGPLEALLLRGWIPLVLFFVPIHVDVFISFILFNFVHDIFLHLNINLFPKRFFTSKFGGYFNTSYHHNLHHRDYNYNYGQFFLIWDRLFKTIRV